MLSGIRIFFPWSAYLQSQRPCHLGIVSPQGSKEGSPFHILRNNMNLERRQAWKRKEGKAEGSGPAKGRWHRGKAPRGPRLLKQDGMEGL